MAYPVPIGGVLWHTRIRHFSNPNVSYQGKATGIADERENYRALINTAERIADFSNPNELMASIDVSIGSFNDYTFTANTCGGNASLSYEWALGSSPLTYIQESTSSNFSKLLSPGFWYLRLIVHSGPQSDTTYLAFNVPVLDTPCDEFSDFPCDDGPIPKQMINTEELPLETALNSAYPNPFNPSSTINYSVAEAQKIRLEVYNLRGAKVATLVEGSQMAGQYSIAFNAQNLPSGTYIVRLSTVDKVQTQKITLIK